MTDHKTSSRARTNENVLDPAAVRLRSKRHEIGRSPMNGRYELFARVWFIYQSSVTDEPFKKIFGFSRMSCNILFFAEKIFKD